MNVNHTNLVRQSITREAIVGHDTSWKISDLGAVQFNHGYDPELLEAIKVKALELKDQEAQQKHLDLTFITGADRFIPEINELVHDKSRLERLSDYAGTKLEPYPLSIVGSTVTYMGPQEKDGTVDWHCDGVPVTELIPLDISDPIIGGELEIYLGNCEIGKSITDAGKTPEPSKILTMPHKMGYSTLGQFHGILHRTAPIKYGHRLTLVLNSRSVERSFIDDNRMFYLAADTDQQDEWVKEMAEDVWANQLPAYRNFESSRVSHREVAPEKFDQSVRTSW